jgi:hypothetical protein
MTITNFTLDPLSPIEKQIYEVRMARKVSYPTAEEQLDMFWHMMDDNIISGKGSSWYETIKQVKQQFPVSEE